MVLVLWLDIKVMFNVQNRVRDNYKKAVFIHCSSHRLNSVLNELNIEILFKRSASQLV